MLVTMLKFQRQNGEAALEIEDLGIVVAPEGSWGEALYRSE